MDSGQLAGTRNAESPIHGHWQANAAATDRRLIEPLTDRERNFLDCLAGGASNKEIARKLCVSENTVKFHLKNVYSKFAVKTRMQAVNAAVELGMLRASDVETFNTEGLSS